VVETDLLESLMNTCAKGGSHLVGFDNNFVIVPFDGVEGPVTVNSPNATNGPAPNGINVFSADDFVIDVNLDLSRMLQEEPYPTGGTWDGGSGYYSSEGEFVPVYKANQDPIFKSDSDSVPWGISITFSQRQ